MTSLDRPAITIHADPEHSGIRMLVLGTLLVIFVVLFFLANALFRSLPPGGIGDYSLLLSCLTALVFSLGVATLVERALKQTWHSGRSLTLDEAGVEVKLSDDENLYIDFSKRISSTKWYFSLKGFPKGGRERRLPSGWYCLACQLQQDEQRLIIYSFVGPKGIHDRTDEGEYKRIRPADYFDRGVARGFLTAPSRPTLPSSLLTSKDGAYWLAERNRWSEGLELSLDDFDLLTGRVDEIIE